MNERNQGLSNKKVSAEVIMLTLMTDTDFFMP